jgi:hypothetical protein
LSWLVPMALLARATRLVLLEGYLYEIPKNFDGDFTRTATLAVTPRRRRCTDGLRAASGHARLNGKYLLTNDMYWPTLTL